MRDRVTFGFRLAVVMTNGQRLSSDEQQAELDLAAPIGHVTLRAWPGGVSFSEAGELVFTGSGYGTSGEAERAGRALQNAIRLAALDIGNAIDVGESGRGIARRSLSLGRVVTDLASQHGTLLLPDRHGLQVFEETGTPAVLSVRGSATVTVRAPLESFTTALEDRAPQAAEVSEKRALACDLLAQSSTEISRESRHLTLCTALEVLSDRQKRTGRAARLVEDFRVAIRNALGGSTDPEERKQLDSLLSGANDFREESIGAAIRRLAASAPSAEVGGADPADLAGKSYGARSDLLHSGTTNRDLADPLLLGNLVRYLCRTGAGDGPGSGGGDGQAGALTTDLPQEAARSEPDREAAERLSSPPHAAPGTSWER